MARAANLALVKSAELPGVAGKIIGIKAQVDKLEDEI
jgi:hypothetical protein